jgi:hypothetical protein
MTDTQRALEQVRAERDCAVRVLTHCDAALQRAAARAAGRAATIRRLLAERDAARKRCEELETILTAQQQAKERKGSTIDEILNNLPGEPEKGGE